MSQELKKCSRCHSRLLSEYFNKTRQGTYQKCCKNCSRRKREKTPETYIDIYNHWTDELTDFGKEHIKDLDEMTIVKCKLKFISEWTESGMTYIGRVHSSNVNFPTNIHDVKGDEILIEFHKFKDPHGQTIITRWRLRYSDIC